MKRRESLSVNSTNMYYAVAEQSMTPSTSTSVKQGVLLTLLSVGSFPIEMLLYHSLVAELLQEERSNAGSSESHVES